MASISDAGTNVIVSGSAEDEVELAVRGLEAQGYRAIAKSTKVGTKWIASLAKPGNASATASNCTVERVGRTVFVRGPTETAVRDTVSHLEFGGAKLIRIETYGAEWQAVCDSPQ
ncbi:MAG TPA: hypothetical protein VKC64_07560 [Burkholderiales bacterium]|nr:hypothetical protein [Burkholderiales bacterium]